jgi:hypothetical protein
VQLKQLLIYLFNGGPPAAALAGGNCPGGVGAGPPPPAAMPPGILPPRACFCGVRSLSLVLPDLGTLSFFLSLIFYSLFLCFFGVNHVTFLKIRIRAKGFEINERT